MFGGINPSKIQGMMKKMGISQEKLKVNRVIFEMDGKNLVIENPAVIKVVMQGQKTYQVSGQESEEEAEKFSKEDIEMVMEKTGKGLEEVTKSLEKNDGDIASAIIDLSS